MADIVKSYMVQLKEILNEQEILKEKTKKLNIKKKNIQDKISVYLKKINQEAVKYNDIVVYAKEKTSKVKLKKSEKDISIKNALLNMGINDPDEILKTIKEASIGEESTKEVIQIKKI